jgi:hypothetical protein
LRLYGATSTEKWEGELLGITAGEVDEINTNITSTFPITKNFTPLNTTQIESCESEIKQKLNGFTDVHLDNLVCSQIKKYTETREELGEVYGATI